jgi:hypothetical protein
MKYYYSHKWDEWLVSSRNWKIGDKSRWWNDTIVVLPGGSTASGPQYRYRHELPWHYRRVKSPPSQLVKIAESWESKSLEVTI